MPCEKWQAFHKAHELALAIYRETKRWPADERYELARQARTAAVSVPNNLAEGSSRLGKRELRRFADIALGSLGEPWYTLRIARDLEYMSLRDWERLDRMRDTAGKLVYALARSMGNG